MHNCLSWSIHRYRDCIACLHSSSLSASRISGYRDRCENRIQKPCHNTLRIAGIRLRKLCNNSLYQFISQVRQESKHAILSCSRISISWIKIHNIHHVMCAAEPRIETFSPRLMAEIRFPFLLKRESLKSRACWVKGNNCNNLIYKSWVCSTISIILGPTDNGTSTKQYNTSLPYLARTLTSTSWSLTFFPNTWK
jgi:hypothetical protein